MEEQPLPTDLLDLHEEELLFLLGESLAKASGPEVLALEDFGKAIEKARAWLQEHWTALQELVCRHPVALTLLDDKSLKTKRTLLFLAIADLVAKQFVTVPPFVISAVIIRHGLHEFCRSGSVSSPAAAEEPKASSS